MRTTVLSERSVGCDVTYFTIVVCVRIRSARYLSSPQRQFQLQTELGALASGPQKLQPIHALRCCAALCFLVSRLVFRGFWVRLFNATGSREPGKAFYTSA
jgi:hypothetical protein